MKLMERPVLLEDQLQLLAERFFFLTCIRVGTFRFFCYCVERVDKKIYKVIWHGLFTLRQCGAIKAVLQFAFNAARISSWKLKVFKLHCFGSVHPQELHWKKEKNEKGFLLSEGRSEQGSLDKRRRQASLRLHLGPWPWEVEKPACKCR